MKFSTIIIIAVAHCAVAYELKWPQMINPIKTAIIDGVIAGRHSDIPEEQARSEVEQFVPLIMNQDLLPIFDNAVDLVVFGTDPFEDVFPGWISDVIKALNDYKEGPDFTSATMLLSSYLPHFDYHEAVNQASILMNDPKILAWPLLKNLVLGISDLPAPSSAIVEGLYVVTGLICTLKLTDGSVCDPYKTKDPVVPVSTSAQVVPVVSSSPIPQPEPTASSSPASAPETVASSSSAPDTKPIASSSSAPASESVASSSSAPASESVASSTSAPAPKTEPAASSSAAPPPTTLAVSSSDTAATHTSNIVPQFTTAPITVEDIQQLDTMLSDVTDVLGSLLAEMPDSPELQELINDVTTAIEDLIRRLPNVLARRALAKRQNSVDDLSAEDLTESVLPLLEKLRGIVAIIEPVENKSEALQGSLDKLQDLIAKLEGWVQKVTAPAPVAEVSNSSSALPASSAAEATSSAAEATSSAAGVSASASTPASASGSAAAPVSSAAGVTSDVVSRSSASAVASTVAANLVTSTLTLTVTHCEDEAHCITPTMEVTTVVPKDAPTTVIKTVCPKCEGKTVEITVPCGCAPTPAETSKPKADSESTSGPTGTPDKASTAPSDKASNGGTAEPKSMSPAQTAKADKPDQAPKADKPDQAPKADKPAQANSGNKWAISGGAVFAGVLALLA